MKTINYPNTPYRALLAMGMLLTSLSVSANIDPFAGKFFDTGISLNTKDAKPLRISHFEDLSGFQLDVRDISISEIPERGAGDSSSLRNEP